MKTLNFRALCKLATLLAIVVIFGSSCKDDDPILPDYVGTWVAVEAVPTETGYVQVKDIMTFTETSFSDVGQIQVSTNKWTDMVGMKGTLSVYGDIMSVTITEMGVTSLSGVNGQPTGVITYYQKGTSEFEAMLADQEQPKTFESKYTVSGNKMTLQTDHNGDSDYLDELETTVYTKQ